MALGRWRARIAREVAAPYQTYSEQEAAKAFVRAHRLTIAYAFHRKLCRKDVVVELTRLYQLKIESKAETDISPRPR
jgi:hypothetical protein